MKKSDIVLFFIVGCIVVSVYVAFFYIPSLRQQVALCNQAKERKLKTPTVFVGEDYRGKTWVYRCSYCKDENSALTRISKKWMETHYKIALLSSKKILSKKEKTDLIELNDQLLDLFWKKEEMEEAVKQFLNNE